MDLKTRAIVLHRVDYGEADRILDLLTPEGKISVIAKGVRKERSKMAGGIELLSVSEVIIKRKRDDGMGVLAGVRLVDFFGEGIMDDLEKLEFIYAVLREVRRRAEGVEASEYFEIVTQVLAGLRTTPVAVVKAWFWLNILKVSGEGVNLWRDEKGLKLVENMAYEWDSEARVLVQRDGGSIGTNEIKMLRLMVSVKLSVVARVREIERVVSMAEMLLRTN